MIEVYVEPSLVSALEYSLQLIAARCLLGAGMHVCIYHISQLRALGLKSWSLCFILGVTTHELSRAHALLLL